MTRSPPDFTYKDAPRPGVTWASRTLRYGAATDVCWGVFGAHFEKALAFKIMIVSAIDLIAGRNNDHSQTSSVLRFI